MIEFERIPNKKQKYIQRRFPTKQNDLLTQAFVVADKKRISIEKRDDEWKVQLLTPLIKEAANQYLQKLKDESKERKTIKERKRSYSRISLKPKTETKYHSWHKIQRYDFLTDTDNKNLGY
ncbi:MAG TPA: hypothetical protein VHE53_04775 [Patescibacteria group bacterium]|nr:hypothetical protein [Patescibacteria group bacterium]